MCERFLFICVSAIGCKIVGKLRSNQSVISQIVGHEGRKKLLIN